MKKSFLLRIDSHALELLKRWADDDLRSLNGQIEFLLTRNLKERGRWKEAAARSSDIQTEGAAANDKTE